MIPKVSELRPCYVALTVISFNDRNKSASRLVDNNNSELCLVALKSPYSLLQPVIPTRREPCY